MKNLNTDGIRVIKEITPLSDKDCFYIIDRVKKEFTYPIHKHDDYELNFVQNGSGVRRTVGDTSEVLGNYDLVLITSGDLEHVWEQNECVSDSIREITIQFSPDLISDKLLERTQFTSIKEMLEKAKNGLAFPMNAIMKVYPILDKLSSESNGFFAVLDFLRLLYELSLTTKDAHVLSSSSYVRVQVGSDSRRVDKVQDFIFKHYTQEIRLSELSDMVGMTPVSFSRFFKLRTGKTLSDYTIDIRLGHAARKLIDTTTSISEICYECGFNNISNFNRIFKKKKGCSPKEFRDSYRKRKMLV